LLVIPAYSAIDPRLFRAIQLSGVSYYAHHGCSDLPQWRSKLLTLALEQDASRVLMIDADIVPEPEQIDWLATTELVTPEQAVTGLYVMRSGHAWACEAPTEQERHAGLGFCAVHAESLRRLALTLPTLRNPHPWWPFCVPFYRAERYYADDYSLWCRLRETGTRLHAEERCVVGHAVETVLRSPTHEAKAQVRADLDLVRPEVDDARQGA
jgi:hypothetical protein